MLDAVDDRDRRRAAGPRHRRDHGRRAFGRQRGTTESLLEIAYFTPEQYRPHRPEARPHQRRAQPLRARRRPGLPRRRAGDPDRADPRHLRRRGEPASTRAGEPPVEDRSACASIPAADRGARRHRRSRADEQQRDPRSGSASASKAATRSCRAGGAMSTGRPIWSRKSTRIVGYDPIPSTPLPRAEGVARPTATRSQMIERRVRRAAAARGLDEAMTWSFISEEEAALFGGAPHVLANPISEEMKHMRPVADPRPGRRGAAQRRPRRVQHPPVRDRPALSGRCRAADGRRAARRRQGAARLAVGQGAGLRRVRRQGRSVGAARSRRRAGRQPAAHHGRGPIWHPGRSATLGLGKTVARRFGELHPRVPRR